MTLSPVWQSRIEKLKLEPPPLVPTVPLPMLPSYYAGGLTFVDDSAAAAAMVQLAKQLPLSHIGIDTEFGYHAPAVELADDKPVEDLRSVKPLLLSITLAETPKAGGKLYEFVVDLRKAATYAAVNALLRLPALFVGHFLQSELFCLWALGLNEPENVWDTWVTEKVFHLGLHHKPFDLPTGATETEEVTAKEKANAEQQIAFGLVATCGRHGVPYPFESADKDRLQKSFLNLPDGTPFSEEQHRYAASDATAAARLYLPQVVVAASSGVLSHLLKFEMPWIAVNAGMAWHGVRINADARDRLRAACGDKLATTKSELGKLGVANHLSRPELIRYFTGKNLIEAFKRGGDYSFTKDRCKDLRARDPAIELIYQIRKVESLSRDHILNPELVSGVDGRVHPQHRHLGAASGRQSASRPNVLAMDRRIKPLIIPAEGFGIGEVDLSQIEIGVAAAEYGDDRLAAMFNKGDVYTAMAKRFFAGELSQAELALNDSEFKKARPERRDIMKTCTLGFIYGLTPFGLAQRTGVTVTKAQQTLDGFMAMFPTLKKALDDTPRHACRRGYAETSTGLRRYRSGRPFDDHEKNWMRNHAVQGGAAAAFKLAGVRLKTQYRQHGAQLILAVHDAYVFEAPLAAMGAVAELTSSVMCEAVRELYPVLRPRAEVNISCPTCWNKDGDGNALTAWLAAAAVPAVT